jgi:uncharacterized protein YjbI with pentapeptide repeats
MRWLKRDIRKVGIVLAGLLLLLILMVWVPMSANAQRLAMPGTVQTTPTVDITATMTALNKEKLQLDITQEKQAVAQQQHTLSNFIWAGGATLFSAYAGFIIAVLSYMYNARKDRQDRVEALEKRAEERFQKVVTDLGSERKEARIAAAIILLTFLQPGYEQFYRQVFDLAVAYLQPLGGDTLTSDLVSLDPLRQALIAVFKESFKRVRGEWKEQKPKSLNSDPSDHDRIGAIGIQLDQAYLVKADLRGIWMREASLRRAHLYQAKLMGAHLKGADFTDAYLEDAQFIKADLSRANFTRARLQKADFTEADISRANFTEADLTGANLETATLLKGTNLHDIKGLTKDQLDLCKAKGAVIDEGTMTSPPQPTPSSSPSVAPPTTPPALPYQ